MATQLEISDSLRALQHDDGRIDPQEVVESARDQNSPLHDSFEWDNTLAAEQHRLQQARRLIASVKVEVVINRVQLRAPVYVRDPSDSMYRTIAAVSREEDQARAAVIAEMQRVSRAIKKARTLALVLNLEDQLTTLENTVAAIIRTAQVSDQPGGTA